MCFATITESAGLVHSNQTGKFPVTSSRGFKYVMVVYDYDTNAILTAAMKNRKAETIVDAYKSIYTRLVNAGFKPRLQRLNNECSELLKEFLTNAEIDFQLVPPGCHHQNAAERAIRTFKNHFIAGLCSVNPDFPLHLWCWLLAQGKDTLNMLRLSHINPKVSAYTLLHGIFDFNRTPIAPPGVKVLEHKISDKRGSWAPHGRQGWYIGPAMDSYRCYCIYTPDTKAESIVDTITWFPKFVRMPVPDSNTLILNKLNNIVHLLKNPTDALTTTSPLASTHLPPWPLWPR